MTFQSDSLRSWRVALAVPLLLSGATVLAAPRRIATVTFEVDDLSGVPAAKELVPIRQPLPEVGALVAASGPLSVNFCVAESGEIISAAVPASDLPAEQAGPVEAVVRRWRFQPLPRSGCFVLRITVISDAPPPPSAAALPRPKNIAHEPSPEDWTSRPEPHLPDAVKSGIVSQQPVTIPRNACVNGEPHAVPRCRTAVFMAVVCTNLEGIVTNVRVLSGIPGADETIVATLKRWRLKPQPIAICFPVRLIFDVQ